MRTFYFHCLTQTNGKNSDTPGLLALADYVAKDAYWMMRIMFKLSVVPLSKQITKYECDV